MGHEGTFWYTLLILCKLTKPLLINKHITFDNHIYNTCCVTKPAPSGSRLNGQLKLFLGDRICRHDSRGVQGQPVRIPEATHVRPGNVRCCIIWLLAQGEPFKLFKYQPFHVKKYQIKCWHYQKFKASLSHKGLLIQVKDNKLKLTCAEQSCINISHPFNYWVRWTL